jgi:hypothetical protein
MVPAQRHCLWRDQDPRGGKGVHVYRDPSREEEDATMEAELMSSFTLSWLKTIRTTGFWRNKLSDNLDRRDHGGLFAFF